MAQSDTVSNSRSIFERHLQTGIGVDLVIPYDRGDLVALIHEIGRVSATKHTDAGTRISAQVPSTELHRFAEFVEEQSPRRDH